MQSVQSDLAQSVARSCRMLGVVHADIGFYCMQIKASELQVKAIKSSNVGIGLMSLNLVSSVSWS